MAKKKRNSRILQEIHETARDLHRIGLIDDLRMAKFDALCHRNETDDLHAEEVFDRLESKCRGSTDKQRE